MQQALKQTGSGPTAEWFLTQYALGHLPRAASLLAQTYVEMNPGARRTVDYIEQIGGWSIEKSAAAPLSNQFNAQAVLDRITKTDRAAPVFEPKTDNAVTQFQRLPKSIIAAVKHPIAALPWQRRGIGAYEYRLRDYEDAGITASLLRIEPGRAVPKHTHSGIEATLVITGAYSDASGRFAAGDLELADDTVDHRPMAESGETCICLAVTEAPLQMTGCVGRILQRLF